VTLFLGKSSKDVFELEILCTTLIDTCSKILEKKNKYEKHILIGGKKLKIKNRKSVDSVKRGLKKEVRPLTGWTNSEIPTTKWYWVTVEERLE